MLTPHFLHQIPYLNCPRPPQLLFEKLQKCHTMPGLALMFQRMPLPSTSTSGLRKRRSAAKKMTCRYIEHNNMQDILTFPINQQTNANLGSIKSLDMIKSFGYSVRYLWEEGRNWHQMKTLKILSSSQSTSATKLFSSRHRKRKVVKFSAISVIMIPWLSSRTVMLFIQISS